MNVLLPFRQKLNRLIKATWPEVQNPVFRLTQIQRINWVNDVKLGKLKPPYVVVDIPALAVESGWSASAVNYKVSPTIYYIASVKEGAGDVGDYIEDRLRVLADAMLFPTSSTVFPYTVIDEPTIDTSANEAVNSSMLGAEMPYLSGSLSLGALIGWVNLP